MEASKVEAVQKMPTPKAKKDVRTFLGLKGYYRKYMPLQSMCNKGEGECVCVCVWV